MSRKAKRILAGVLIAIGILLLLSQPVKRMLVRGYHPYITADTIQKNNQVPGQYDYGAIRQNNLQDVAKARAQSQKIHVVGVIAMPAINMSLPISKGVTNVTLALSAATMRPNVQMGKGNYALAGHNMGSGSKVLFSPLYYHTKKGQMIYLSDLNRVYYYKVYQRKIISPTDVKVVNNTKRRIITLITCNENGSQRLLVRGRYISSQKFKNAPKSVQRALSKGYTTGR